MRHAWLATFLLALGSSTSFAGETMQVADLRCEYLTDPLGIDAAAPRLSWTLRSGQRGQRQTAYQVLVASSPERLAQQQGDLWDSGRVASDATAQVVYAGKPLGSRQACFWKVRAWDRDGQPSDWSQPARWEMGLLRPDDWTARWIAADLKLPSHARFRDAQRRHVDLVPRAGHGSQGRGAGRRSVLSPARHRPGGAKSQHARLIISVDRQFHPLRQRQESGHGGRSGRLVHVEAIRSGELAHFRRQRVGGEGHEQAVAAGVCAKLVLQVLGQRPQVLTTDRQWKSAKRAAEGWTATGFDDAAWKPALELVPFGQGVWGSRASRTGGPYRCCAKR